MAGLAERLGQPFEAKVLRTIAMATEPEHRDPIVRSSQDVPCADPRSGTLADLLAEELDRRGSREGPGRCLAVGRRPSPDACADGLPT